MKAAKANFQTAFDAAEKGEHAKLAPAPVAESYLDDAPDVAFVKANFKFQYDAIDNSLNALPVLPYNYAPAAFAAPVAADASAIYSVPPTPNTLAASNLPIAYNTPSLVNTQTLVSPPGFYGLSTIFDTQAVVSSPTEVNSPVVYSNPIAVNAPGFYSDLTSVNAPLVYSTQEVTAPFAVSGQTLYSAPAYWPGFGLSAYSAPLDASVPTVATISDTTAAPADDSDSESDESDETTTSASS